MRRPEDYFGVDRPGYNKEKPPPQEETKRKFDEAVRELREICEELSSYLDNNQISEEDKGRIKRINDEYNGCIDLQEDKMTDQQLKKEISRLEDQIKRTKKYLDGLKEVEEDNSQGDNTGDIM